MASNPNKAMKNNEDEELCGVTDSRLQTEQKLYPEMNPQIMKVVMWLGFAFIVMVILVQHFSGYS